MRPLSTSVKLTIASLIFSTIPSVAVAKNCKNPVYKNAVYKDQPVLAVCDQLKDGFYLGGQVGYDSYWVRENIALPAPGDIIGSVKFNAPGWVGGLFLGYGKYFYRYYYMAAEILGNYSQANQRNYIQSATTTYSSKITVNGSYGVSLLPGIQIANSTLAYVRLGYLWTNFKANEITGGTSVSKSNTSGGFQYGLGLETLLVNNWSVRAEYTHTNNTSFTTSLGTNFDPSDNQVMLGLIYHFA